MRSLNCLASCPRRLGLWVFSPTPDFESLASVYVKEGNEESKRILVDTTVLKGVFNSNLFLVNLAYEIGFR